MDHATGNVKEEMSAPAVTRNNRSRWSKQSTWAASHDQADNPNQSLEQAPFFECPQALGARTMVFLQRSVGLLEDHRAGARLYLQHAQQWTMESSCRYTHMNLQLLVPVHCTGQPATLVPVQCTGLHLHHELAKMSCVTSTRFNAVAQHSSALIVPGLMQPSA